MDNILTYAHGLTRVATCGLLMESDQRPELPFAFDALYYEPPTGLAFRVLGGEQQPLNLEEIAVCNAYCDTFPDTAEYPVHTYDATGVYAGTMLRTEAVAKSLDFRIAEVPDHPASKWTGTGWERVVTSILEDGTVRRMPDSLCVRCVLALTEAEWAAFPPLPAVTQGEDWHWNFVSEAWEDRADPSVFAFDEVGAFVGVQPRSTLREGWGFSREAPTHQASVMTDSGWERLSAVIDDEGWVLVRPESIHDAAILLLTREEWARWPQRPQSPMGEVWVWDFRTETWRDVGDYLVAAYEIEEEQAGVFVGNMSRSVAEAKELGWTRIFPEQEASKWNGTAWEPIHAAIMDDGTLHLKPAGVCQRCMVLLTESEWAAWPQPERKIPPALGGWQWNFVLERWEDRRPTEDLQRQATRAVRSTLYWTMQESMDPGLVEEALLAAVGETKSAPFLVAMAEGWGRDVETVSTIMAEEFVHTATVFGRCAGQIRAAQAAIGAATDNREIDAAYTVAVGA